MPSNCFWTNPALNERWFFKTKTLLDRRPLKSWQVGNVPQKRGECLSMFLKALKGELDSQPLGSNIKIFCLKRGRGGDF